MSKPAKPTAPPEVKYDRESELPTLRGPHEAAAFAASIGITASAKIIAGATRAGEIPFYKVGNRHDYAPADIVAYFWGRRSVPREVEDQ